ncbi:undecaprenyldiphospho-muramoylpentapeptide beta-N-acetylglucosaminyltransferase [Lactobacillus sp. PFC-70]|uniref:undecaprenyldiphospho-muramoylpentapeptide beta-N-acetylglucosaminyltransferase n=1 Tax=Levilactobacillus namurensis TaxID=380393 RepID=UPI000D301D84|nr:undecaprenyldiphospho-muramoylpentapeptide beta-N-acetylglucosaminyltransferase [Levilactobacillus namurensis]MCW3778018.1 undecaprenyldiphospho-muramoylpentapeptide beta-N-acetylglucosaminyltransferase [Levilactobacillus namurensis]MDT7018366.1 undecaprenyldiphospho-muramoylpentapeptide beta-N-acetylglucosaminyltransferase [Levilactobacillus namurensis]PTM23498.1 undecaprenyldiphospho-muramoylpentapeptide beta-N-acetylglucosaminyltransferase [Lactobacillus sp. PFC-70]WNN64648.1 undecaprenyl
MRLMVSGGGTGGHIYPALALIKALKKRDPEAEVLYVGSERGLESTIVPAKGIPFKATRIQGFKRSLSLENFKTVYLFLKSVHAAKKMIREFKPDVVVGTGGYVSGAVVYAASRLHVPTMIHEQNSVVGMTNKFLSRYVDKIAYVFDAAIDQLPANKMVKTGNPRAQEAAEIVSHFTWDEYGLKDDVPTLLIFGGSQGALKINAATVAAIPAFNDRKYQVVFVTGQKRYDGVMDQLKGTPVAANVVVKPYIPNMPEVLPRVAAIVGRAGATSLAEITADGIPSILIPSPYVTADHQTKNAQSLVTVGAAELIKEADLTGDTLVAKADQLMNDDALRHDMADASKHLGVPDAADRVLDVVLSLKK